GVRSGRRTGRARRAARGRRSLRPTCRPPPGHVKPMTCLTVGARAWKPSLRMTAKPQIMLGFVVRQCAVALGHPPTPDELAAWANEQRDARGRYRIFG